MTNGPGNPFKPANAYVAGQIARVVDLEFSATGYLGGREHVLFLDAHGEQLRLMFVYRATIPELLARREELRKSKKIWALVHVGSPLFPGLPGEYTVVEMINGLDDGKLFCIRTVPGVQTWEEVPEAVLERWHEIWGE